MNTQAAYNFWSATYDIDTNLTRDLDQYVTEVTLSNLKFKSALEIGCGTGKNTNLLSQIAETVHAIDFSESMLQKAKEKLAAAHVTFSRADITHPWPCPDQSADLVIGNLVLEHIEELSFVFSEASRCLAAGGMFFVCELHPFKQYQGAKANFQSAQESVEIPAFLHHVSDFFDAAKSCGLTVKELKEWWHPQDQNKPPRLLSFVFQKIA